MNRLQKENILQFITGQQAATEIIEREECNKLPHLSKEESRKEYSSLCAVWFTLPKTGDIEALSRTRISELIEMGHRLDIVASHRRRFK